MSVGVADMGREERHTLLLENPCDLTMCFFTSPPYLNRPDILRSSLPLQRADED
jgi:hypothetical protein